MHLVWLLLVVYVLAGGLLRLIDPGRYLRAEQARRAKALEKQGQTDPEMTVSPEEAARKLNGLRLSGALRLVTVMVALWAAGVSVGWQSGIPVSVLEGQQLEHRQIVEAACERFLRSGKATALAVGAVGGTNRVLLTLGTSGLSQGPVTPDTLWEIGSITKVFTGIALAREVESGAVNLDEPIKTLLPESVQLPPGGEAITLGDLTSHTSGLPRVPPNMPAVAGMKMVFLGGDPYAGYSEADFIEGLRSAKLRSKPGESPEYSNFGTGLLGWLLAKRAGLTYEQYIVRQVCVPLGMENTRIELSSANRARLLQGYRWMRKWGALVVGLRSAPWTLRNHFAGAGGLRSTGGDMLRFLVVNMNPEGSPLAEALRTSHEERVREDEKHGIGMNWIRSRYSWSEKPVVWHNGGTGGYRSYLGFTEDGQAGVVVLSNSSESVDELGLEILKVLAKTAIRDSGDSEPQEITEQ